MSELYELASLLQGWREASERYESELTDACLTSDEIIELVDGALDEADRERVLTHLSMCSFCAREVGSLSQAARQFDDRLRARQAVAGVGHRLEACLRVIVDETRGAFTYADALLRELSAPFRVHPVATPPMLGLTAVRGVHDEDYDVVDPDAIQELALEGGALSDVEMLCGDEGGGSVLLSAERPFEVRLVAQDGSWHSLEVERGDERYYATASGVPPGEYLVTILRPEEDG